LATPLRRPATSTPTSRLHLDPSFPSGHATFAAAVRGFATVLAVQRRRPLLVGQRARAAVGHDLARLKRAVHQLPDHLYPPDPWRLIERRVDERYLPRAETLYALANGYLGTRGTLDEGRPTFSTGAFVNGFHETWPIIHAEAAYGFAPTGRRSSRSLTRR
jgi:alpha,alpha-trehalose phosphorylase